MVWQAGQSGNPSGRPRKYYGLPTDNNENQNVRNQISRNQELAMIRAAAEAQDLMDPLEFQHRQMMDESLPIGLRCSLATAITPYFHPKLGLAANVRFIETTVEVPDFKSIEEAESFLAGLARRFGNSELGSQSALDLSTLVRNWISAKRDGEELELKRLASDATNGEQVIRIEGGLPALPGSNVIMPDPGSHTVVAPPPVIEAMADTPADAALGGSPPAIPPEPEPDINAQVREAARRQRERWAEARQRRRQERLAMDGDPAEAGETGGAAPADTPALDPEPSPPAE